MNKWYDFRCARLLASAAILTGVLSVWGSESRAGVLQLTISDGTTSYDIMDGSPLDTNPNPNQITAMASGLVFPDFTVIGLNASTNNPGAPDPTGAVLTASGEVQRSSAGGPLSLTITATDTDYAVPVGPSLTLSSGGSALFTNVPAGDTSAGTSWFNPSNTPPPPAAKEISSGTQTFVANGTSPFSPSLPPVSAAVGSPTPYGLTNETVITLSGTAGAGVPDVVFGLTTQVRSAVVPEPASLSLLAAGFPLAIWGWIKRRRLSLGS
jgi:hypothetical protein